jgi:hypothetical protein
VNDTPLAIEQSLSDLRPARVVKEDRREGLLSLINQGRKLAANKI